MIFMTLLLGVMYLEAYMKSIYYVRPV